MIIALEKFITAFLSLFVTMDPIGMVALYIGITHGIESQRIRKIRKEAIFTAGAVVILFLVLGKLIFKTLGITVGDFRIAGGLILFVLAARDLISNSEENKSFNENIGIVPLGVPLIAGPATITTSLILVDTTGVFATLTALITNLFLIYFGFSFSTKIKNKLGVRGLQAFSKIISLLLAALAINMIRRGLESA